MSRIEARLEELGLKLPVPMKPPGNFKLVNVHEGVAYIAGHTVIDGSNVLVQGVVGRDLTVEEGYEAARLTGLSILASLSRTSASSTVLPSGCVRSATFSRRRTSTTTLRS
jgi:hypothetical protein